MAPFFHYQFFTFPERLSHTSAGPDPVFQDSAPFTMDFDDGAMKYLESQKLDIVLFDDNAPMTGIERGGQSSGAMGDEVDDLIGTCAIPLAIWQRESASTVTSMYGVSKMNLEEK